MELSKLKPAKGSRKVSRRIGRGEGSGAGKTSGRGGKGQTARSGGTIRPGFEGGQMPLYRRLPKFGFTSRVSVTGANYFHILKLGSLEVFNAGETVDLESLKAKKMVKSTNFGAGIKILHSAGLTKKLNFKVAAISTSARTEVERLGGSIEIVSKFQKSNKTETLEKTEIKTTKKTTKKKK
ncbi:MAG: 50S ribosomal protein L15 [bacterium]|nr:50S ribosomal protein L15 [bacterium]